MTVTTRTIVGLDDDGRQATVTVAIDEPEPKPPPMLVGINVPAPYEVAFAQFPTARATRVFFKPGEGLGSWSSQRLATLPATVLPHVSWKDWPDDHAAWEMIQAWLDQMPAHLTEQPLNADLGVSLALSYHHEPEGDDLTSTEYQRRWGQVQRCVEAHRYGHLVATVPVATGYYTVHKLAGNPFTWWAGVGSFAGVDLYADLPAHDYPDPEEFLAPWLALAEGTGRRLWVAELGATLLETDPDGSGRAEWIRQVVRLLRFHGCAAVSWWSALGSSKQTHRRDYRLADGPSSAAWSDALAGAA